jgi:hypothetical protein
MPVSKKNSSHLQCEINVSAFSLYFLNFAKLLHHTSVLGNAATHPGDLLHLCHSFFLVKLFTTLSPAHVHQLSLDGLTIAICTTTLQICCV